MTLVLDRAKAVMRFSGPPADRMAGRPSRAARAAAPVGAPSAQSRRDHNLILDEAINRGLIGCGLRDHYAASLASDPQGTLSHLQALGLPTVRAAAPEAYDERHLSPHEREAIAATRDGRRPRIVNGGL